jgi:hypothetical protein
VGDEDLFDVTHLVADRRKPRLENPVGIVGSWPGVEYGQRPFLEDITVDAADVERRRDLEPFEVLHSDHTSSGV